MSLQKVRAKREQRKRVDAEFYEAIREAYAEGFTGPQVARASGLRLRRVQQVVRGIRRDSRPDEREKSRSLWSA